MQIYFLDEDFKIVFLTDKVTRLEVKRKFFSPGRVTVRLPSGVTPTGDARYVFVSISEGVCALMERKRHLEDGSLEISGRTLEALLERRIIKGECIYDDRADTCVLDAVRRNALNDRGLHRLEVVFSDDFEENIVSDASWQSLGDWVHSVLRPFGGSFKVTLGDAGVNDPVIRFSMVRGADRTMHEGVKNPLILSERLGNVENVVVDRDEEDFANVVYVQGSDGTLVEYPEDIDELERREIYVSAKDIRPERCVSEADYREKLTDRGIERLALREMSVEISADLVGGPYYAGMVCRLGDLCEVELMDGTCYKARLTEMDEIVEDGKALTKLRFGNDPVRKTDILISEAQGMLS